MRSLKHLALMVPLPTQEEVKLRRWALQTIGATWPVWGGHLTLVNHFETRDLSAVKKILLDVTGKTSPFRITLNQITCTKHWFKDNISLVTVKSCENCWGNRRFQDLRRDFLHKAKECIREHMHVGESKYFPHLSLTMGLPAEEARQLAACARKSELSLSLVIRKVYLYSYSSVSRKRKELSRLQAFTLSGNSR